MLEIDKSKLSKLKYIFEIYTDYMGNIHCEKFPIIYINEHYVYYKKSGDDMLTYVPVSNILSSFRQAIEDEEINIIGDYITGYIFKAWLWSEEPDISDLYEIIKKKKAEIFIRKTEETLKSNLLKAKNEYDSAEKAYNDFMNRKEKSM